MGKRRMMEKDIEEEDREKREYIENKI